MGLIREYMEADHARLDRLRLAGQWWEFRGGLFRHIGLEEKILLPEARRRRGGEPLPEAARLREDHSLLVILLVPPPSPEITAVIDKLLGEHNRLEEGDDGMYAHCEALGDVDAIAERLRAAPETPQRKYQGGPLVQAQIERALETLSLRR